MKALISPTTESPTSIVLTTAFIDPADHTEPSTKSRCDQKFLRECGQSNLAMCSPFDKLLDNLPEPMPNGQIRHEPKPLTISFQQPILLSSSPAERPTETTYSAITKILTEH